MSGLADHASLGAQLCLTSYTARNLNPFNPGTYHVRIP